MSNNECAVQQIYAEKNGSGDEDRRPLMFYRSPRRRKFSVLEAEQLDGVVARQLPAGFFR